jgi:hypothetical protein
MPWLAQMERVAQVVGVEGVPKAVSQFNNENKSLQMRRKVRARSVTTQKNTDPCPTTEFIALWSPLRTPSYNDW